MIMSQNPLECFKLNKHSFGRTKCLGILKYCFCSTFALAEMAILIHPNFCPISNGKWKKPGKFYKNTFQAASRDLLRFTLSLVMQAFALGNRCCGKMSRQLVVDLARFMPTSGFRSVKTLGLACAVGIYQSYPPCQLD